MAISNVFNEELQLVANNRSFIYDSGANGHSTNEFTIDGWTIRGGSDSACSHGASEALYRLGYRFYDPETTIRPSSIPAGGLNIAKQEYTMPYIRVYLNYQSGLQRADEFGRWQTLNQIDDTRRLVGHTWGSIYNRINSDDGWFDNNPGTWLDGSDPRVGANGGFNLELTGAIRQAMVDRIAEDLVPRILESEDHRHAFDPQDGDRYTSDQVVDFANEVVAKVRETVPDAKLGIYAYANHRAAPTNPCPHLYVQIALGFNNLGIGYPEMVRQWGEKAGEVALRGYGDIAAQSGWLPSNSAIEKNDFITADYPYYVSQGADSLNMETSSNWVKNALGHYFMIRWCKTQDLTFAGLLDEYVNNVYDGDPAAKELFEYWSEPSTGSGLFVVGRSFEIIDTMQDGPRKTLLQQYITLMWRHLHLGPGSSTRGKFNSSWTQDEQNQYWTNLEQCLRWAWWLGGQGHFFGYGYARQLANANTTNNGRPDLTFDAGADWKRNPAPPSTADYEQARDEAARAVGRPDQLNYRSDLSDLVVVDVAPEGAAATRTTTAYDFNTGGQATFIVAGPSTVTVTYDAAFNSESGTGVDEYQFESGLHKLDVSHSASVTWDGGHVFLKCFPSVRLDPSAAPYNPRPRWGYIPKIVKGKLRLRGGSRLSIFHKDSESRVDISGEDAPQDISSGVIRIDGVNTRGTSTWTNTCPFISGSPYKMLMPRALAEKEFPDGVRVTKP